MEQEKYFIEKSYLQDSMFINIKSDVSEYIYSGEFKPDSCNGKIYSLIKKEPLKIQAAHEPVLQNKFKIWTENHNRCRNKQGFPELQLNAFELYKNTAYKHSVLGEDDELIHIYITNTGVRIGKTDNLKLLIDVNNIGEITGNYRIAGGSLESCKNFVEEIQVIYDEGALNYCLLN